MQMELSQFRGLHVDDNTPSKALLYWYSKYRKEREEEAQRQKNAKRK